jgi:pimeloyl-ACP methyl ester carboxylesterase
MIRFLQYLAILFLALSLSSAFAQDKLQDKFFNSNGVQIRYVEQGAGEPVILVHGFTANIEMNWVNTGVFQDLAKDYQVIALGCRGHGKSGKPHDPKQYGRKMATDIVRLLDHLRVKKAHIVGYSMGAHITALLLTTHPDRFLTATLGGAAGHFHWTPEDVQQAEREASEMEQGLPRSLILRLSPPDQPKPRDDQIRQWSATILAGQDLMALAAFRRSVRDQVITEAQAAAVTVPTLGIVGSADPNLASLQALKKLRPALQLVVVEGAMHYGERGVVPKPKFVAAIRDFLASHREKPLR